MDSIATYKDEPAIFVVLSFCKGEKPRTTTCPTVERGQEELHAVAAWQRTQPRAADRSCALVMAWEDRYGEIRTVALGRIRPGDFATAREEAVT